MRSELPRERRRAQLRRRPRPDRHRIVENVGKRRNPGETSSAWMRYILFLRHAWAKIRRKRLAQREMGAGLQLEWNHRAAGAALEIAGQRLNIRFAGEIRGQRNRRGLWKKSRRPRGEFIAASREEEEGGEQQKAEHSRLPAASSVVLFGCWFAQAEISSCVLLAFSITIQAFCEDAKPLSQKKRHKKPVSFDRLKSENW